MRKPLGHILTGSLTDGFLMRIAPQADLEDIKTGKFVSIVGKQHKFFSLITDLSLEVTHPDILLFPPSKEETLLSRALRQKDIYAIAQLKPMLMLNHKLKEFLWGDSFWGDEYFSETKGCSDEANPRLKSRGFASRTGHFY